MNPLFLLRILCEAQGNPEKLERLKDTLFLLNDDFVFIGFSRGCFLPAAHDYLQGKKVADYRFQEARRRRSSLGGASRWLYYHQKNTFEKAVQLLCPFPVTQGMQGILDQLWQMFQAAEIQALRKARNKS